MVLPARGKFVEKNQTDLDVNIFTCQSWLKRVVMRSFSQVSQIFLQNSLALLHLLPFFSIIMRAMEYSVSFFLLGLLALMPGIDCKDITVHEEKDYHMGKGLSDFLSESKDDHSRSYTKETENLRGHHNHNHHKHNTDSDRDNEKVYLHEEKDIHVDGRPVHHLERDFLVEERPSFSVDRDQRMRSANLRSDNDADQLDRERTIRREKENRQEEKEELEQIARERSLRRDRKVMKDLDEESDEIARERSQLARERSLRRDRKVTMTSADEEKAGKLADQLARERVLRREKKNRQEKEELEQIARELSLRRDRKVMKDLDEESDQIARERNEIARERVEELARERSLRREKVMLDLDEEAEQLVRERALRRDKKMLLASLSEDDDVIDRLSKQRQREISNSLHQKKSHRRNACEELLSHRRSQSDNEMDLDVKDLIRELRKESQQKDCPYLSRDRQQDKTKDDNVKVIIVKENCESSQSEREDVRRSCPQSVCRSRSASEDKVARVSRCDKKEDFTVEDEDDEIVEEVKVTLQKAQRSSSPSKSVSRSSSKSKTSHENKKNSETKKGEKSQEKQKSKKHGKSGKGQKKSRK